MKTNLKIDTILVLAKMSNGKIYNVLIKKETQDVVINTISLCENGISLLNPPIDGIDITTPKKMKKDKQVNRVKNYPF